MSKSWIQPSPTLVIDDKTGEWVMTHNITRVLKAGDGSNVYVRQDETGTGTFGTSCCIKSPMSPKELRDKLFDL